MHAPKLRTSINWHDIINPTVASYLPKAMIVIQLPMPPLLKHQFGPVCTACLWSKQWCRCCSPWADRHGQAALERRSPKSLVKASLMGIVRSLLVVATRRASTWGEIFLCIKIWAHWPIKDSKSNLALKIVELPRGPLSSAHEGFEWSRPVCGVLSISVISWGPNRARPVCGNLTQLTMIKFSGELGDRCWAHPIQLLVYRVLGFKCTSSPRSPRLPAC